MKDHRPRCATRVREMPLRRYAIRSATKAPIAAAIAHQARALAQRAVTASGGKPHNVATLRRVMQARANIVRFQVREIDKNLGFGYAGCEHLEDVRYANTHTTNAGASAALEWVERDSVERCSVHVAMIRRVVLACHSGAPTRSLP